MAFGGALITSDKDSMVDPEMKILEINEYNYK